MGQSIASLRKPSLSVYKVLGIGFLVLQSAIIACVPTFSDFGAMCLISLIQLVLCVAIEVASPCRQPFSIVFLVANWIFHCGQIACLAAGYDEALNLDFRLYGSSEIVSEAFRFYLYSQTLIAAGSVLFQRMGKEAVTTGGGFAADERKIAYCLILTGLPFWLFVNISQLTGAASEGYRGVYSLIIPAPIQALAFFFEAGLILLLLDLGKEQKGATLFWAVAVLKVVLMSTGSRQYSVCFLAVWCLIYFCHLRRLSLTRVIVMVAASMMFLFVVDAFGELRTDGFSLDAFIAYCSKASFLDVIWDSLGEFGCAFSTLVVCMSYIPMGLAYGMGSSYLAGVLSIVPTLVGHFPALKAATLFTTSIPGTSFFGGSMLGEFYYNFGWFGLIGPFFVGIVVSWCQNCLNEKDGSTKNAFVWAASVIAVFLLLFIRGYFTDAIMKVVYVFVFAWLVDGLMSRPFLSGCRLSKKMQGGSLS